MLGERSDQRGLWEADRLYLDHVGRDTFYGLMASLRGRLFRDADFAAKDRSWDEDVHTLRRLGLGEVFAVLVNTGLNALRLEGWFPSQMSMPLRAKSCAFRPTQTIARLYGRPS